MSRASDDRDGNANRVAAPSDVLMSVVGASVDQRRVMIGGYAAVLAAAAALVTWRRNTLE